MLVMLLATSTIVLQTGRQTDGLKAIAERALENRQAFPFINCRFVFRVGTADSEDKAISDGPFRVNELVQGTWIVDKDRIRYELHIDEKIEQAAVANAKVSEIPPDKAAGENYGRINISLGRRMVSRKILWGGGRGIHYVPIAGLGGLSRPDQSVPETGATPFSLTGDDNRHPGRLIEQAEAKPGVQCRYEGTQTLRGREVVVVAYDYTFESDKVHSRYWFDPERGFLPVQMTRRYENPKVRTVKAAVTAVRECSGGRWFPMRIVQVEEPGSDEPNKRLDIMELAVTELNVDTPPSEDLFAIDLPQGARLNNGVDPYSQGTLQQPRHVRIADFDDLAKEFHGRAEKVRSHLQEQPKRMDESHPRRNWILTSVSTAVVLILVLLLWLRHR